MVLMEKVETQLGAHTLRSHSVQVDRTHMHDWLIVFLLAVIDTILNVIEPYRQFVWQRMVEDLICPLKGNAIPFWAVLVMIGLVVYYFQNSLYLVQHF